MTNRFAQGRVPATFARAIARRSARISLAIAAVCTVGGCSWFGGHDDANAPPQPIAAERSPDPTHDLSRPVEDDPHEGLVSRLNAPASTADGTINTTPMSQRPPMVLAPPSTAPAASAALPEYLVLGSVVANVNGTPIYAHELVKQVAPVLKARAKDLTDTQFKQAALRELTRQRQTLILDELEYAAAQRNTTTDDAKEAQARTYAFREHLISQAGGSEQLARTQLAAQGEDFDKVLAKEERRQLVRLYYVKKVFPRVAVSPSDMRRYYDQNRDTKFTVPSQATIRMIRIDPKDIGSDAAALQHANEARSRAAAGENFDVLSDEYNKMSFLVTNKGRLGPVSPGAYKLKEVDDAIWRTPAGKVSDVVHATDGAYYVVLMEQRTDGRVKGFDEQEVQDAINGALRESRMTELQQRRRAELMASATVQADDAMLQPVVEMAMQMYPSWHAGVGG